MTVYLGLGERLENIVAEAAMCVVDLRERRETPGYEHFERTRERHQVTSPSSEIEKQQVTSPSSERDRETTCYEPLE